MEINIVNQLYINKITEIFPKKNDATRKLLELINDCGKVAGYKINTLKSVTFLYSNNERSETFKQQSHLPSYQKE